MKRILVTGMPYSGKTYISAYLKKQGVNVMDADHIKGLGTWFDKKGREVVFLKDASQEWLSSHDFLWDKKFL